MSLSVAVRDGVCHMRFRGRVTAGATSLDQHVLDALQRHNVFKVDLSEVEVIDERSIRVLLLMKRLGGRIVSVGSPSPAVLAALDSDQLAALETSPGGSHLTAM